MLSFCSVPGISVVFCLAFKLKIRLNVGKLKHVSKFSTLIECTQQKTNPKTGEVSGEPVGMMDVYQEFSELSEKFKVMKFKSKVGVCPSLSSLLH